MEVVSQVSSAHKERTDIRLIKDALTDVITSMDSDHSFRFCYAAGSIIDGKEGSKVCHRKWDEGMGKAHGKGDDKGSGKGEEGRG